MNQLLRRSEAFCQRLNLQVPILLAPMAGVDAPSLSIAVANAGGLGACGALMMRPDQIDAWAREVRAASNGNFQINLWIPDPPAHRDREQEARVRTFLAQWGPAVPAEAADAAPPNFEEQCQALLAIRPPAVSSVMGLYPAGFVAQLKQRGIVWLATVSTLAEARAAEAAGADALVVQGMEAGGHRGCFEASNAERQMAGLFALVPAVADAAKVPVVAAGAVADGRGIAAAMALGASAVQIGTGFLRCPEANLHPAWAGALAHTAPEDTVVSRVFSGRAGRSITTDYVRAAMAAEAPPPAPYPVQRGLTAPMRSAAQQAGDLQRMQAWAGQAALLARAMPAAELVRQMWEETKALLA
jgi:nitronate monooxygenase